VNTVGITSNALFGNSANNFFEPFSWCKTFYQHSIFSADEATILFLCMQKLRKRWRTVRWRQYWRA